MPLETLHEDAIPLEGVSHKKTKKQVKVIRILPLEAVCSVIHMLTCSGICIY